MFMQRDFDLNSVDVCVDSAPLKEAFKKTMVTQEIIFQSQVHELHRIYGTQRTLMMQNDTPDFFGGYYNLQHLGHHDSLKLSLSVGDDNKRTRSGKQTWFDVDLSREVIDLEDSDDDDFERRNVFFDLNEDALPKKQRNSPPCSTILEFDLNEAYCDSNKSDTWFESNEPTTITLPPTPSASHELVGRAERDSSDETSQKEAVREKGKSEDIASDVSSTTLINVDDDALVHEAAQLLMHISFENKESKEASEIAMPELSSDSFEQFTLGLEECNDDDYELSSSFLPKPLWDLGEKSGVKIRRGRRRVKDFQRDVLPGMASLTRHEIREDINILEGVLRSREYKQMQARQMADTWRRCVPTRTRQGKRRSRFS